MLLLFIANFITSVSIGVGMVIAPWILGESLKDGAMIAMSATASSALLCVLTPWVGYLIHKVSSRIMIISQIVLMSVMALLGFLSSEFGTGTNIAMAAFYFCCQLFFGFFYISRTIYIKETVSSGSQEMRNANSLMEIETQASSFLISVIALFFLKNSNFSDVFLILSVLLFFSGISLFALPPSPSRQEPDQKWTKSFITVSKDNLGIILFSVFSTTPFVVVMMYNMVTPTYLNSSLQLSIVDYAIVLLTYTLGALAGGYLPSRFVLSNHERTWLKTSLLVVVVSFVAFLSFPMFWSLIALSIVLGLCNAMSKVMMSNIVMQSISNESFNSVLSSVQTITYGLRTLLSIAMALSIANLGTLPSFGLILAYAIFGLICFVMISEKIKGSSTAHSF